MKLALKEAEKAYRDNDVPVGAVIVFKDEVVSKAHNQKVKKNNALCHAEIMAIDKAAKKIHNWHLDDMEMYVTLEPCAMCAGAIMQSRIKKVVYGTKDPKGGSIDSTLKMYETKGYNHYPIVVSGVLENECSNILKRFFKEIRNNQKIEK